MSYKIAIIDDHILIADALKGIISKFSKFEVIHVCENGLDFQKKIAAGPLPELVLLDISMPIMDGLAALENIRGMGGEKAQTPVVVLSADGQETAQQQAIETGADDYLIKPIKPEALEVVLMQYAVGKNSLSAAV